MSSQRARKIRTGSSRRRVSNQNAESEADDGFHKTESPSVAQDHMVEGNTASLLDLAKLDSQSGSQHLPSLEVTGNRRKLGSSRRSKGRRDVKDSIAESYHEIRQEVLENTSDKAVVNNSSLLLQGTTEMESTYQSQDMSYIQFIHSEKQSEETNPENKCTEHKSTENSTILTEQNESLREESRELSENRIVKQSEELPTNGRQNEHFRVSQVIDANLFAHLHQPEDAVNNKAHEQEVKPAQIKEMHATENDNPFGHLIDVDVEIGHTYQSELIAKSVDVNKQEASNPDKQDGHPTKQNNSEVLNLRNEDGHIYDSSEPKIKQSERVDTAPVQGYNGEGQVGDDMKAIAVDIVHQEKEKLPWEIEDNESSIQTLQTDAGGYTRTSDCTGKRRKMASTRKKFQDKPKQTMTDETLKVDSDNDNKDVDVEDVVCGGETSELEMSIDFKDEYNSQSTLKEMKESARLTLESMKSTSHEKTSCNIDSPLVETYQLDCMTYSKPSISGWQHYPPSPLYSPPQDNSVGLGEQTNEDYQTTGKIRKMSSTHKYYGDRHEEENTEWMQEETILSQAFQEHSETMTTEIGSSLAKDDHVKSTEKVSDKEKKLIKELESGSQFTGYEEFKTMESLQSQDILFCEDDCQISDIQNVSYHDKSRTSILGVLTQEEAFEEQNTEAISCDTEATRQEIQMKQTNEVIETLEDFTKKDLIEMREEYDKEAEGSMDVKVVSEKDEQFADHTAQETNTSHEITYIKLLSGVKNKNIVTDMAAFDKEALEKESSVSEQSEDETDVHQSQQGILDRPYQSKDDNENAHIKSRRKRKMGSTRKNLLSRRKEGGIHNKDETKEDEFNTECDVRNQETLEAELKTLVQPKCNTTDLHVIFDKGETDMTCASYISNQPFNQEENITGNMGIIEMGNNIQPHNEPKETVEVDQSKNISHKYVGGFSLTTCTSAAIQMTDNEEMINNEPEATERGTADSAPRSLLGRKDNEVTEEVLKEKKEVVEIVSVMETAEVLQTKLAATSLNTTYNDVIEEEEQEHQEPAEMITCQGHEQDLHNIDIENNKISGMDVSIGLLTEEFGSPGAPSHCEDIGTPVMSDIRNSDGTVVGLCVEPSQSEDVMSTEMHITSVVVESNSCSLGQMPQHSEDYINTDPTVVERRRKVGSFRATARSAEKAEKMPEVVEVLQDQGVKEDQVLKSEETSGMDEEDSGIVKSGDSGGPGDGDALTNIQELNMSEGAHMRQIKNASRDSNRRRKMGSTRRNLRGRPKGEDVHKKQEVDNEMSKTHKYYGDRHEEENTEWMQEETILSQAFQEHSKTMTTEIGSSLAKDDHVKSTEKVSDKEKKLIKELESGSPFTGYEEIKTMESLQSQDILFCEDDCQISDIQNVSYHDKSRTSILEEEAFEEQNTEAISCDIEATRQEIQMKQTNEVIETLEYFTKKDLIEMREEYDKEAEGSTDVKVVSEKDEQFADHTAQETNTSHEITYIKLLPGVKNTNIVTDMAAFDKEALEKESSVSEQSEDETDVHQSQQGILDRPYQSKDNNENAHIKSRRKRKMGSTRKNLLSRRKEGGIHNKDETKEDEFNTECDVRNQETLEAELKTLVQPKCNTTDLHVRFDKGETDMTCASYISNQPFNQEENISGNMGIIEMGNNIQPHNEPKETVQMDQSKNISNKYVGGFFLTTCTSAAIQMTDNEEMINNEPEATERGTADSAPRSLLGRKDNEVTEEVLKEKKEVVEIVSVMETAEVLQTKLAATSLNTTYNDVIEEEEQEHQEPAEMITCQGHEQDLGIGASDLHNIDIENNKISGMDVSIGLLTEEFGSPGAPSHCEDIGTPVMSDIRNSDGTVVGLCVEPSQSEDVMSTEMHITSVVVESNSWSLGQMPQHSEDYINTDPTVVERRRKVGSFRATARSAEKMPEVVEVLQDQGVNEDQVLKSEETSGTDEEDSGIVKSGDSGGPGDGDALTNIQELNMSEGAHMRQIKNASRDSNRRRKMGSTRRNLRGRPKREDVHKKQEVDNEMSETAKNIEDDVMADASNVKAKSLVQMEHRDSNSDQEREKIVETVKEGRHFCDTYNKHMAHLTPSHLPLKSANFQHDVLSESKVEGRRRKMGSNRKSHAHKLYEDPTEHEDKRIDPGDERDLKSNSEESAIGTFEEHRAESFGLDKPELATSYHSSKTFSSNKSILRTGPKGILRQGASEQVTSDQLVQETGKRHSLGTSKERDLRPNCYNVVMVGNSNVGKTSFLKRAQSGKFCVDFSASVGIDTCMQSMRVDGETVVLRLWDTAGQERFHSITRQILHKAQAFLLMYDITSFQSFSDVRYWVSCIEEGAAENTIIMLLGNKSDCAKRQVNSHEAEVLAKEYNFDFMECSAATGENVIQSLDTVARMLSQKFDTKEEGMVLDKEPRQKKSSGCC